MMTDRRQFFKRVATGAASVSFASALADVHALFAEDVNRLDLTTRQGQGFEALRGEYMLGAGVVYLNHASIGTIPRPVHEFRTSLLALCETNPWLYMWGGEWEGPRESVRQQVAQVLHADPTDVAITHNTTETFSILANGLPLEAGDEVLFSSLNHEGAARPFFHLARRRGFQVTRFQFPVTEIPTMSAGDVIAQYDAHITPRTRLIVIPHIDNIVGMRYPVRELAAHARSRGVEFIAVDAAQSVGMIDVDVPSLGVDVYASSPHKWLQAPKGLGLAYVSPGVRESLEPMWVTWGQNRWAGTARQFEDYGTRNLAEVVTLGAAIDFQSRITRRARRARLNYLRDLTKRLTNEHPATHWVSPNDESLTSSIYTIGLRGQQSTQVSTRLGEQHGIMLRPFNTQGLNAVRLSPNVFTAEEDIHTFFGALD